MKNLILLILLSMAFTAGAQTAQQDSAHRAYLDIPTSLTMLFRAHWNNW